MMLASCSDDEPVTPNIDNTYPLPEVMVGDLVDDHHYLTGAIFSFQHELRDGTLQATAKTSSTTYYNLPLFEMKMYGATEQDFWDELVEEMVYSGIDYAIPNCRGRLPKADTDSKYYADHGDPTHISKFIDALKRRGETHLKIAIFDDAPASWAAAMNLDLNGSYSNPGADAYPIDDFDLCYKYIWDYNIKLAFDNFYNENSANNQYLLRYNGKPVLYIWNINGFVTGSNDGKIKKILNQLHSDFKERYGDELFICADKSFIDRDPEVTTDDLDAVNNWFTAAANATATNFNYTLYSYNGHNVGVAVPGFSAGDLSGAHQFIDANHGKTLTTAFDAFVSGAADLVMCESFVDMAENASYWRSKDTVYYDFPNQRVNLLRKYNADFDVAYPKDLRVEAEACDYFYDTTSGNSGQQYRDGDLDVMRCDDDSYNGWCVTNTAAGEWLSWVELPFRGAITDIKIRYSSIASAQVRCDVAGNTGTVVTLPSTSGQWVETTIATVEFDYYRWRELVLNIVDGDININYLRLVTAE